MAAAGVPAEVGFATKPALAQAMISDALDAGVPASWVAADEVYGADSKLRRHLRQAGLGYVLAVAKNHQIITGIGPRAAIDLAARLPKRSWQRLSAGRGCKGERWYDWALVDTIDPPADPPADPRVDPAADPADPPAPPAGAGAGQHWLLIRRSRTTGEHASTAPTHPHPCRWPRWSRSPGGAGRSRSPSPPARSWPPWTSTRCGPGRPGNAGPRVLVRDGRHRTPTSRGSEPDPVDPQRDPPPAGRRDRPRPRHRTRHPLVDLAATTPSQSPNQPLRPASSRRRMITRCRCRTRADRFHLGLGAPGGDHRARHRHRHGFRGQHPRRSDGARTRRAGKGSSVPGYASRRCGPTPSGMPACKCGTYTSFCVRPSSTVDSTSSRSNSGPSRNRAA